MSDRRSWQNTIVSLAAVGPGFIGVFSFAAALFPFFSGEFVAAGILLIASALSFGLLSIAVIGK